jgi:hypothetical protein
MLEDNHFHSAILVTSWDHMPRSYFLLRAMILGSEVTIQPHPVATGSVDQINWYYDAVGWKMVCNEMVEFWGSLIELTKYKITGELPEQVPGGSSLARRLKQLLLFGLNRMNFEVIMESMFIKQATRWSR